MSKNIPVCRLSFVIRWLLLGYYLTVIWLLLCKRFDRFTAGQQSGYSVVFCHAMRLCAPAVLRAVLAWYTFVMMKPMIMMAKVITARELPTRFP